MYRYLYCKLCSFWIPSFHSKRCKRLLTLVQACVSVLPITHKRYRTKENVFFTPNRTTTTATHLAFPSTAQEHPAQADKLAQMTMSSHSSSNTDLQWCFHLIFRMSFENKLRSRNTLRIKEYQTYQGGETHGNRVCHLNCEWCKLFRFVLQFLPLFWMAGWF